jgi:hypothetical protein
MFTLLIFFLQVEIQPAQQAWKSDKGQKRKSGLLSRGKSLLSKSLGKQRGGD